MSKKIGIIGAMTNEIGSLSDMLEARRESVCSGITFYEGKLCGKEVVLAVCGVGKVFAAICAQTMVVKYGADVIVNTGVAGSLDKRIGILDAVVAADTVQHDMDTSPLGDPVGMISGINVINFKCDEKVVDVLRRSAEALGVKSFFGTIASGDAFVADDSQKKVIRERFDALACEMEGAAIGHAAYINGIPYGVLRIISDDCAGMDYMTFADSAAKLGREIILNFLKEYE